MRLRACKLGCPLLPKHLLRGAFHDAARSRRPVVWWDAELIDEGRVPMACLDLSMSLDETYAGVEPPPA